MKIISCEQYSETWWAARRGLPTSSKFDKLITPGGKASTQSTQYMYELIAEGTVHEEEEAFEQSEWMLRGSELEPEARNWLSMKRGEEVRQVGLIVNDAGTYGASPDGLPGDAIGLEIKCPKGSTHVRYLDEGKLPPKYAPQVHGQMLVTGFDEWLFMSYHPNFEPLLVTVKRDDYTKKLEIAVDAFVTRLAETRKRLGL